MKGIEKNRSFNISRCYQQVHSIGKFIWASLNIWFRDVAKQKDPIVIVRESLSYGNPVAGLIIELVCNSFIDKELTI